MRQANRGDFQANPIHAVVGRKWQGKDDGPGGNTVLLTNAPVGQPLRVFDDDDDRRLIDNCGIKEAKQPWEWGHPPQQNDRAVRGHVVFTLLLFALATAYRRPCAREATGGEPVGWPRWRRVGRRLSGRTTLCGLSPARRSRRALRMPTSNHD